MPGATPALSCPPADVVVLGAGALGAATAWWLARTGHRVVLLEERTARELRLAARGTAWSAHPGWVDEEDRSLLGEAVEAWREVERRTGATLLTRRDALDHGDLTPAGPGTRLDPAEAAARWPALAPTGPVLLRRGAGLQVRADHAVATLAAAAAGAGALVRHRSRAEAVVARDGGVEVRTRHGRVRARRAVVTSVVPAPSPAVELHFSARGPVGADLPLVAHHDPVLGLVRVAPCARGHVALGAASRPWGTAGDLDDHARSWFGGLDARGPEPVGPEAMSTAPARTAVVHDGPVLTATSTASGSLTVVALARRLAEQVVARPAAAHLAVARA